MRRRRAERKRTFVFLNSFTKWSLALLSNMSRSAPSTWYRIQYCCKSGEVSYQQGYPITRGWGKKPQQKEKGRALQDKKKLL